MFRLSILSLLCITVVALGDDTLEKPFADSKYADGDNGVALNVEGLSLPPYVVETLTVTNGEQWGSWGHEDMCSKGSYAVGYDIKLEPKQSWWEDDTALNGIRLICKTRRGAEGGRPTSSVGPWGNWNGPTTCSDGHYLTSFTLQVEKDVGVRSDDTAANFVKFKCRDIADSISPYEISIPPGSGPWGSYGGWSKSCPRNSAICGLKTRVESPGGDDTALNDVKFYCC